ncbi:MAG TPA: phosphoenolpyruvate carboxykinase domain-containing protein, partial [Solirubrobacteraceae bacterium]
IGYVPAPGTLDVDGLGLNDYELEELLEVDPAAWQAQLPQVREYFAKFGDDLPAELRAQLDALEQRLADAS